MIVQREIQQKASEWKVPPDTVDKDYVLGHFLSVFAQHYANQLIFKGGTCLRKCYIENYRFSEDLDFTSGNVDFILEQKEVNQIAKTAGKQTGIEFSVEKVKPLISRDLLKGYQVYIKYWGANHSKNQRPLPPGRWLTKIKLEVSTDEIVIADTPGKMIKHPYSDSLTGALEVLCYSTKEIVAEKLRSLKQRSYTAPRDFYDLYYLTEHYTSRDWEELIPIFLKKMEHKELSYNSPEDLIDEQKLLNVERAWKTSVAHQIHAEHQPEAAEIIKSTAKRIKKHLPTG